MTHPIVTVPLPSCSNEDVLDPLEGDHCGGKLVRLNDRQTQCERCDKVYQMPKL